MSEPLGLAEMTETPLVMVEAMRAGPSTGMPTKSGQGDLEHVLYTSQGDSCRVVFAPGDPTECYELTRQAFKIAYDYQIPTLVVYDSKLSGELRSVPKSFFDREPTPDLGKVLSQDEIPDAPHDHTGRFERFQHDAEDGVSQRTLPGQRGGRFLATGNEHWPNGQISEDPTNRVRQMDRRLGKLETIRAELDDSEHGQTTFGDPEADFGIVTWGSTKGTVEEAVERLNAEGTPVKGLCCGEMVPFPTSDVGPFLESVDEAMVVEMNATAQFREHVQKKLGAHEETLTSLLKYNGEPFRVEEVVEAAEIRVTGEPAEPSAQTALDPTAGD
jgi:pyruvate ferredoxin oxidoreductase alpha subunit